MQVRAALERPPHLTAIWPDVVPTNMFQHQTREGGAMQLHMFWALYIHAADAQDVPGDPEKQEEVWDDLRNLRQLFWEFPHERGTLALRHVPALDQTLEDYTPAAPTTSGGRRRRTTTRASGPSTPTSRSTMSTGWYDGFPHADTEYFARDGARGARRRSGCSSGRGATSACAAT